MLKWLRKLFCNQKNIEECSYVKEFYYFAENLIKSASSQLTGGHENKLIRKTNEKRSVTPRHETKEIRVNVPQAGGFVKTTVPNVEAEEKSEEAIIELEHFHDVFNPYFKYIRDRKLDVSLREMNDRSLNKYLVCCEPFRYIDLDRVDLLFSSGDNLSKDGQVLPQYKSIVETARRLKGVLPHKIFLYYQNALVLVDKNWLTVSSTELSYKCSGRITVVGRINKRITSVEDRPYLQIVDVLNKNQRTNLEYMEESGFIASSDVYLITPIAIYIDDAYLNESGLQINQGQDSKRAANA